MTMTMTTTTTMKTVYEDEAATISAVHPDILLTHILSRIDGPTLVSVSSASSQLHSLSTEEKLWSDICRLAWPSINHQRIQKIISTFSDGPRSFFSDSFPLLIPPPTSSYVNPISSSSFPSELISAVDIHYKEQLIFSKFQETETITGCFLFSPFRIDLLDQKDVIRTHIQLNNNDACRLLDEELRLSWIVLDPFGRRAANISSGRAVSVQQHWLTREIEMKFVTVLGGVRGSTEFVQSGIIVTCGRSEEGEMHVREVSLQMEDMDEISLNGKDSLGILLKGMLFGRRMKGGEKDAKERYEEYLRRKEERKQRRLRREGRLDSICVYFGLLIFLGICVKFAIILINLVS